MAVPRSLSFLRLGSGGQALEVYIDPICPYSAKILRALDAHVAPLVRSGGKYDGKLQLITRIYPQPFHFASHYNTEALLVFGQQYPALFWDYLLAVFEHQREYFNVPAQSLNPGQIRDKLVNLAADLLESKGLVNGPKSKVFGELRDALEVKEKHEGGEVKTNGGNAGEAGLKHTVKIGRQNGIHVTPTALFDGLKEDSVSSSWGKEEWEKFLDAKLKE